MCFWASPRSLVATQGISVDFFSSGYLDISVPRVRPAWLCIHHAVLLAEWVSPFGHCRIKACCQLPDTFRRLPRPSSPLTAKASTVCAYSLDHITPSRLGIMSLRIQTTNHFKCWNAFRHPALAFTKRLDPHPCARYVPNCQRTRHRLQRQAASNLYVCAQIIQSF